MAFHQILSINRDNETGEIWHCRKPGLDGGLARDCFDFTKLKVWYFFYSIYHIHNIKIQKFFEKCVAISHIREEHVLLALSFLFFSRPFSLFFLLSDFLIIIKYLLHTSTYLLTAQQKRESEWQMSNLALVNSSSRALVGGNTIFGLQLYFWRAPTTDSSID
jgi:hypothetical protein